MRGAGAFTPPGVGDPFGVNLGERSYPIRFGADLRAVGRVAAAKRERGGAVFAAEGDGIGDLAGVVVVRGGRGSEARFRAIFVGLAGFIPWPPFLCLHFLAWLFARARGGGGEAGGKGMVAKE